MGDENGKNEKYIFTFGASHLRNFYVNPNKVMLVVNGDFNSSRDKVFNFDGIGSMFCTSYPYDEVVDEFKKKYGMREYTLDDLEKQRIED